MMGGLLLKTSGVTGYESIWMPVDEAPDDPHFSLCPLPSFFRAHCNIGSAGLSGIFSDGDAAGFGDLAGTGQYGHDHHPGGHTGISRQHGCGSDADGFSEGEWRGDGDVGDGP